MSDYIRGTIRPHEPGEEQGISLAGFGIPPKSMSAWMKLQSFFIAGEVPPCSGRPEWVSNKAADKRLAIKLCGDCVCKAACREFAEANNESFGIWGGHDFSKGGTGR